MRRKPRKYKPILLPKLNAKAIGHRLRALRVRRAWYQLEVANMIGIDNSIISAIECGDRLPSRDVLLALSNVFKVRLDYILLGRGSKKKCAWSRGSGTGQARVTPSFPSPVSVRNLR